MFCSILTVYRCRADIFNVATIFFHGSEIWLHLLSVFQRDPSKIQLDRIQIISIHTCSNACPFFRTQIIRTCVKNIWYCAILTIKAVAHCIGGNRNMLFLEIDRHIFFCLGEHTLRYSRSKYSMSKLNWFKILWSFRLQISMRLWFFFSLLCVDEKFE